MKMILIPNWELCLLVKLEADWHSALQQVRLAALQQANVYTFEETDEGWVWFPLQKNPKNMIDLTQQPNARPRHWKATAAASEEERAVRTRTSTFWKRRSLVWVLRERRPMPTFTSHKEQTITTYHFAASQDYIKMKIRHREKACAWSFILLGPAKCMCCRVTPRIIYQAKIPQKKKKYIYIW